MLHHSLYPKQKQPHRKGEAVHLKMGCYMSTGLDLYPPAPFSTLSMKFLHKK
jgi:hypothetical protein